MTNEPAPGATRSNPWFTAVLFVSSTYDVVVHAATVTVVVVPARVTTPTKVVGRVRPPMAVTDPSENTLPAVTRPDVLIGCVVDQADCAAAPTEYLAII